MEKDVRVALIGYGFSGKTFHAPFIAATPGLRLTTVVTRHPENVIHALPSVEVADSKSALADRDIGLVVIATPNDSHFPLARAALLAGKHVIIDKPFTTTVAEAEALAGLSRAHGLLLSVFHNRRWDSDFLTVRAIIDENLLGEVVHLESRMDRFRPQIRDRWRERSGPGSGLWFDLGPHLVDQALQLFGMPLSVSATISAQRPGAETDDWAHVLLDYGRCKAVLHCSLLAASGTPRFMVHGTRGSAIKRFPDRQEAQLIAGMRPGDPQFGQDSDPADIFDGSSIQQREARRGDYGEYYRAIVKALTGGAPNPIGPEEAIKVMTVLEAAAKASTTGHTVSL